MSCKSKEFYSLFFVSETCNLICPVCAEDTASAVTVSLLHSLQIHIADKTDNADNIYTAISIIMISSLPREIKLKLAVYKTNASKIQQAGI